MTAPIGSSSKGSILPGLDQVQQKIESPFLQACGMGDFLKAMNVTALFNIQSVALGKIMQMPALLKMDNKIQSVFQSKGQGKG